MLLQHTHLQNSGFDGFHLRHISNCREDAP